MSPDGRWRVGHMIEAAKQALSFSSRNILWDTVQIALPPLLEQLRAGVEGDD